MYLSNRAGVGPTSVGHEEVGGDLHGLVLDPPHRREGHLPEATQPCERAAADEGPNRLCKGAPAGDAGAVQKPWHRTPQSTSGHTHTPGESARGLAPLLHPEDHPSVVHHQDSRSTQGGGQKVQVGGRLPGKACVQRRDGGHGGMAKGACPKHGGRQ